MMLLSRVAVVLLLLIVPLALALGSQALAERPGAPVVPSQPVSLDGRVGAASPPSVGEIEPAVVRPVAVQSSGRG